MLLQPGSWDQTKLETFAHFHPIRTDTIAQKSPRNCSKDLFTRFDASTTMGDIRNGQGLNVLLRLVFQLFDQA